ncbi:hypothetical protein [Streptomyces sp. MBT53]|uniref:hypothetical protein n=1 Tax=Streptomyces sp. MBT53 TaxID=1488384 RepID=UPI001911FCEF|nr:hypothetical protein [Streptomyces sp. MBT53]MBK6015225.1 hypothetical protein [Streptomyces sp. MBT53]
MAWEEWEQLKADAVRRGAEQHMRLDQLPAGAGGRGAGGDLVVHQDDLGAVGHEAYILHDRLRQRVDIGGSGSGSTTRAGEELKGSGFAMGPALVTTVSVWTSQVKSVLQAVAHISNHLDYSKKLHAQDDTRIAAEIRGRDGSAMSVSSLSRYFH